MQVTELAPFSARPVARRHAAAPVLNVAPRALLPELVEQYLFAALSAILSGSLLAENTRRLQHMDNALQRLEQRRLELSLRRNFLRQQEITEEIEVIMLGAGEGGAA